MFHHHSISPANPDTTRSTLSSRGMILLTTLLTSCTPSTTTVSPQVRLPQSALPLDPAVSNVLMTEACVRFLQRKMEQHRDDTKAYPCVLLAHLSWQSPRFFDMVARHLKHACVDAVGCTCACPSNDIN